VKAAGRESDKYLLGIALFLAMVIGGGTRSGLVTDSIIEVVMIAASAYALGRAADASLTRTVRILALLAVAAILLQLLPLPRGLLMAMRVAPIDGAMASADSSLAFISLGVGRTLRALIVMTALVMFFFAVSRLRPEQVLGLLPFLFIGVACNIIAGAIQFSVADEVVIDDLLSYRITAGFFANVNHFSALLFVTIPFLVYHGVIGGSPKTAFGGIIAVLLMLLAAGSRAGVGIGVLILIASVCILSLRSKVGLGFLAGLFAIVSVVSMGAWMQFEPVQSFTNNLRLEFIQTTWTGIRDNWLLGIGYGNFEQGYQIYERPERIFQYFVNHAHNEYVQLLFEGGFLAGVLIAAYLVVLHVRLWHVRGDGLRKVSYLAILFLLLHSIVDYPLRNFALLAPFALFNAILFYSNSFYKRPVPVRVDDVEVFEKVGRT
jgi:O-antigen ligase